MAESQARIRWAYRGLYVALAGFLIFLRLLPIDSAPVKWPGPDLLLGFTFAWVLRRPDYVPALLIAMVVLLEDFLTMRPPGLWAVIVLLGAEFLRGRVVFLREVGFLAEWLMVAIVMLACFAAYRFAFAAAFLPLPDFAPAFARAAGTVLAYPLVVALTALALGLRKAQPGEVDSLGKRL
ncbi:rod shape-determining protein MreD [Acidimangrovimonas sediminis]|uniref:rod shape-determining protein MreD n=1 Tax=Acidimangrovimonas sediminis TaxID=2056283 RepID=UPI000C7FE356|nr:rod shape-determining protein MreD [Acidimangrovimonas sediminis]